MISLVNSRFNIKSYFRSRQTSHLLIYLFFFTVCFSVYFNALNNNFIFDDNFLIVKNLYIKNIRLIPKLFKTDIFYFQHSEDPSAGNYYRPLQALSYAFDYFFWKLNPVGYRIINIIIHSANAFLAYLLIYLIFKDKLLALLSAIFFSIHPIQVCLVTFIAGRSNLLETLFMFLSLLMFVNYCANQKKVHYVFSLLLFVFALLTREGALLLPIFIVIYAILLNIDKKRIIIYIIPYIVICIFYVGLRNKLIPCDKFNFMDIFSLERISRFIWLTQEYLRQLILPAAFQSVLFGNSQILKLILLFVSLAIAIYSLVKAAIRRDKIIIFALGIYFIALLPIIKLIDNIEYFGLILSEHYVYMASVGFFVFVAHLTLRLHSSLRKTAHFFIVSAISTYSILTVINNTNYKDDLTFYNHILNADRNNIFIRVNLGTVYYEKKMYAKAIEQANLVLAAQPGAWDAYLLLGNVFKDKGDLNKAIELYRRVIILNPRASEAFNNLGLIYKDKGMDNEALENFKRAVQINPEAMWALQNLADFSFAKGLYNEALPVYKKILKLNPRDVYVLIRVGIILAQLNHFNESEIVFREALRLDRNSIDAMKNLGALYGNMEDFDRAISVWKKALNINPSNEEIKNNIEEAKRLKSLLGK